MKWRSRHTWGILALAAATILTTGLPTGTPAVVAGQLLGIFLFPAIIVFAVAAVAQRLSAWRAQPAES
jgi:hypothetical protein